jgi:hypothetical protein
VPRGLRCTVVASVCNTCDLKVVLTNLGPCAHRGGSCSCLEAASRVVLPVPKSGRRPYTGSRVWLTRELVLYGTRRGDVPSRQSPTASGMAPQRLGWGYSARDGRTGSEVTEEMCSAGFTSRRRPRRGAGSVVVHLSRASLSLFEGCGVEEGREWAAQCQGMTPAISHSTRTAPWMEWRVARTASGPDSQAVSVNQRGGDSLLTQVPAAGQNI